MNTKIIAGIYIVLALLVASVGVVAYHVYNTPSLAGSPSDIGGAGSTNFGEIYLTPQTKWGNTYALAFGLSPYSAPTQTEIDINGNWSGNVKQASTSSTAFFNDAFQSADGFAVSISTSTTLTAAQQCLASNIQVIANSTGTTLTFAAATTTYATCGTANGGPFSIGLLTNDATTTVTLSAGTNDHLKFVTEGSATTTVLGTTSTIPASSVSFLTGEFDTSSSLYILVGPTYN